MASEWYAMQQELDDRRRAQAKADEDAFWASPRGQAVIAAQEESVKRSQTVSDRDYGLEVQKLKAERDRIAISEGTQKANQWYQKESIKLAEKAHELAVGEALGYINGSPTLSRERYQSDAAQGWATLGTQQRGPENAFQYLMLRGQAGNDPLAGAGFSALAGGPQANAGSALSGQTTPASLQGLSAHLLGTGAQQQGGGAAAGTGLDAQAQGALGLTNQFGMDPGKAAGQSWEALGDYGQKVAGSFLQGGGYDPDEVLARYRQTRFVNAA